MVTTGVIWAFILLIGGCLIFWIQVLYLRIENDNSDENLYSGLFVLPWLFGTIAGGAITFLWFVQGDISFARMPWWSVGLSLIVGAVVGFLLGVVGLITDPGVEPNIQDQFETTLVYLSFPFGIVLGTSIDGLWRVPGPAAGFCIGPLLMSAVLSLFGALSRLIKTSPE